MDADHDGGGDDHLKAAVDKIREETLPALGNAYDQAGPATVLALAVMLADVWLESGFTTSEWRKIIDIYDLQGGAEALRSR